MKKYLALLILASAIIIPVATQKLTFADKPLSPLTEKDALAALFKNTQVLLKDARHCDGVGMVESDKTIGDYLSGFWSLH